MRYFQREPLQTGIQNQLLAKTSTDWASLTKIQRRKIVAKLLTSQKALCAYCECTISRKICHIDHFEERHDSPRIFDYFNFLLCCQGNTDIVAADSESEEDAEIRRSNISCGHRKTKSYHGSIEIDYTLLLNPTDNVSALFSYENGVVEPSRICTHSEQIQVQYTIKRLNLDAERLEKARIDQIDLINMDLIDMTEEQQKAHIRNLLDETQDELKPYFSTIKDNFGFMLL